MNFYHNKLYPTTESRFDILAGQNIKNFRLLYKNFKAASKECRSFSNPLSQDIFLAQSINAFLSKTDSDVNQDYVRNIYFNSNCYIANNNLCIRNSHSVNCCSGDYLKVMINVISNLIFKRPKSLQDKISRLFELKGNAFSALDFLELASLRKEVFSEINQAKSILRALIQKNKESPPNRTNNQQPKNKHWITQYYNYNNKYEGSELIILKFINQVTRNLMKKLELKFTYHEKVRKRRTRRKVNRIT